MKDKPPDIYPPSIIDPLKPGGIPSPTEGATNVIEECQRRVLELGDLVNKPPDPEGVARDRYLGELARENLVGQEAFEAECCARMKQGYKPAGGVTMLNVVHPITGQAMYWPSHVEVSKASPGLKIC